MDYFRDEGRIMIATEAAWRTGDAWLDTLLAYLAVSRDLFDRRRWRSRRRAAGRRLRADHAKRVRVVIGQTEAVGQPRRSPTDSDPVRIHAHLVDDGAAGRLHEGELHNQP